MRVPDLRAKHRSPVDADDRLSEPPKRVGLMLGLAFTALLLLVVWAPGLSTMPGPGGAPQVPKDVGYTAMVDRLVHMKLLRVTAFPSDPGVPTRRVVELDPQAFEAAKASGALGTCGEPPSLWQSATALVSRGRATTKDPCKALFDQFRRATYLATDMERASPDIWELEGGQQLAGIRGDAHALVESGTHRILADDRILYARPSRPATRVSDLADRWTLVDPRAAADFDPLRAEPGSDPGERPCARPSLRGMALRCVENALLLMLPDGGRLIKNGRTLAARTQARLVVLRHGDVITVAPEDGAGPVRSLQLLHRPLALSEVAPDGQRVRDPSFAGLLQQIDTSIDSPVEASVQRDLQRATQRALENQLTGAVVAGAGKPVRAALLLMDGLTGEIAAAASYPRVRAHLPLRDQQESTHLSWLRQNWNFDNLAVGSAAKVPFAAAITQAYPSLLDPKTPFRTRGSGNHCMNWVQFDRDGTSPSTGGGSCAKGSYQHDTFISGNIVDFETFIAYSNNFYAMSLLRYAEKQAQKGNAAWLQSLMALTCASKDPVRLAKLTGCPGYPWGTTEDPRQGQPLAGLRLDFDAGNRLAYPRETRYYTITGAQSYGWTTVQLAQAYARLLTGTGISARLTRANAERPMMPDDIEISQRRDTAHLPTGEVWRKLTRGMQRVMTEGTARKEWRTPASFGAGTVLLGKTGTPTIEGPPGSDEARIFVLAVVQKKPTAAALRSPSDICGLRIVVANIQRPKPSGVAVIRDLIAAEPAVQAWLAQPCAQSER